MVYIYSYSLSLFILAGSAASSAFVPLPHMITKPCHGISSNNNIILYALEEKKDRLDGGSSINLDTFISSLPSPEDLKENILEVSSRACYPCLYNDFQHHNSSVNLFL